MAQHNPGSRAFLLIVLGGIVVGFVIAAYLLGGDDGESGTAHQTEPAATEDHDSGMATEEPVASGGTAPPREMPMEEGMSDGVTPPPEEIPMDDSSLSDGMTPPEERTPEEPMPDEAPDAVTPEQTPEQAVPENPPLVPNP